MPVLYLAIRLFCQLQLQGPFRSAVRRLEAGCIDALENTVGVQTTTPEILAFYVLFGKADSHQRELAFVSAERVMRLEPLHYGEVEGSNEAILLD